MKSKKMGKTKKLLFVLLALALLGMVPVVPAFAGEGELETQATAAEIVLITQGAGTLVIANKWTSDVIISRSDQPDATFSLGHSQIGDSNPFAIDLTVPENVTITIRESNPDATFRSWSDKSWGLVSGVPCAIIDMPSMSAFTSTSAGTTAADSFFCYFNGGVGSVGVNVDVTGGSLTSLPAGSFYTSGITTAGDNFFRGFNAGGSLTSLPEGSFDTSNITTVGGSFFADFNSTGSFTSLPVGSFDISGITTAGNYFFRAFNDTGLLASLPAGSFDTSNITTAGSGFFSYFNRRFDSSAFNYEGGSLTSLPEGSFDISGITTADNYFFDFFNGGGALTSLPEGSFDISGITTVGDSFFSAFNYEGSLTALPEGSFDISGITTVGDSFFSSFNSWGSLTSLPTGSFNTSHISTAGDSFFRGFNDMQGALTSLPAGSFNISGIRAVGDSFFYYFNGSFGSLTSLPQGSFDTSGITTVGDDFFLGFNSFGGALTSLPNSFRLPQEPSFVGERYCSNMFANSALTSGNRQVPLYFSAAASAAFEGTDITPVSPEAGATVYVNGSDTPNPVAKITNVVITRISAMEFTASFDSNTAGTLYTAGIDGGIVPQAIQVGHNVYGPSVLHQGYPGLGIIVDEVPLFLRAPHEWSPIVWQGSFAVPAWTPPDTDWPRLDGNKGESGGRFDTMQAIVTEGWKDTGSEYVIVASGGDFPDALAASSLAGIYDAPVVLTETATLTPQAQETIQGLHAQHAYVIGGPAAVSDETFALLEGVVGAGNVSRVFGDTRIETALDIYEKGKNPDANQASWGDTAIIASGFSFADALSVSPFANATRSPIFLSNPDSGLDGATVNAINGGGFTKVVIVGGTAAVPASVEGQLAPYGTAVERWWGENRYETSAEIIEKSLVASGGALSLNNLVCATGSTYPDALAGGAFAGHTGTVLLLVHTDANAGGHAGIDRIIRPHASEIGKGYILGGSAAVPDELLAILQAGAR
jgi:putative cell wall-binding protein